MGNIRIIAERPRKGTTAKRYRVEAIGQHEAREIVTTTSVRTVADIAAQATHVEDLSRDFTELVR